MVQEQTSGTGDWIVSILLVSCLFFPILAAVLFARPVHVPVCKASGFANVRSDSEVDGRLEFTTGNFAVRTAEHKQRFLTRCFKGGCFAPYDLLREKIGRPVHAEFCGKFLTLVASDQVPLYTAQPPSQEMLNASASRMRTVAVVLMLVFFLLFCGGIVATRKASPATP